LEKITAIAVAGKDVCFWENNIDEIHGVLGTYESESRAKEVLMELFWKYGENQYLLHPDSEEWYEVRDVYQMPEK